MTNRINPLTVTATHATTFLSPRHFCHTCMLRHFCTRSLHNMRTFIHVNLCISLAIAQLIFVAGVNKSTNNPVPIHCQAIAVLLHYFFLVSFMWMLMEGVVLYVILVRVFVTNTRRYILAYTIASYGVPLLYMGLTIPLGFALPVNNYGYQAA